MRGEGHTYVKGDTSDEWAQAAFRHAVVARVVVRMRVVVTPCTTEERAQSAFRHAG